MSTEARAESLQVKAPGAISIMRHEPTKTFILFRHADARSLLADASLVKDPDKAEPGALVHSFKTTDPRRPGDRDCAMLWMDNPDHARVRGPIAQALYRRVAVMRPAIERLVNERLDALQGRSAFDALSAFAIPVPIDVIAHLFGVEAGALPRFRAWSEGLLMSFKPERSEAETAQMLAAVEGFNVYLEQAIAERRRAARDDLISDLVAAQTEGAPLSDAEIRVTCLNLLAGGNLTTGDLIANTIWLLLKNPDELAALRADPTRIAATIEESLRVEAPVEGAQRITADERVIGGCPVHRGGVVAVSIPAANHDPLVFEDPFRFDIGRERRPHLSFGGGAHICIGAPLARLEAQIAVRSLIERFPNLRLADPSARPQWRDTPSFHGMELLAVEI